MRAKLTPRQQKFVEFYAQSGNATDAARRAGYAERYVRENAPKILQKTAVKDALAELTQKVSDERIADAAERQRFWTGIMRGEDVYEKAVEIDLKDRLKAAELLGKAHQDFVDKTEITGAGGAPLTVRWMTDRDESR